MLYDLAVTLLRPIFSLLYRVRVYDRYEIPQGATVVVANHAHVLDPIIVSIVFPRKVHWMAKKELYKNRLLAFFLRKLETIPVDREGKDLKALRESMKVLREGEVLGIFPEGTRVKDPDPKGGKSGTAVLASKMKAQVIPLYIESQYSLFRPTRVYFRQPLSLEGGKKKDHDYVRDTEVIMRRIYDMEEEALGDNSC